MAIAYLGIGANIGNRQKYINDAIRMLYESDKVSILRTSSIYETLPVGGPPQQNYLNGVIKIETMLLPVELLKLVNNIENTLGRVRSIPAIPTIKLRQSYHL